MAFLRHEPCPECGSKDNFARYADGGGNCNGFGCEYFESSGGKPATTKKKKPQDLIAHGEPWEGRGINSETCRKLRYSVGTYQKQRVHVVSIPDQNGNIIAQKLRLVGKDFRFIGDTSNPELGLVFQDCWPPGSSQKIVVTEGEIDALSVSQVQNNKYPVVSVPNGADGAVKACARSRAYLNSFAEIVFMFDMDEPGKAAAMECARLFGTKAKVASLPLKDANACLQEHRGQEVVSAVFNAMEYRPDGIVKLSSLKDAMKREVQQGRPWIFPRMTELTYGRRPGELYFFGAGSGIGKTDFFLQQITSDIADGYRVAMFLLEQPVVETGKRLAGKQAGKRFHIPAAEAGWTEAELDAAVDAVADKGDVFLYDHFGSKDWDTIQENIRWLNITEDVTDFYVDHLTALTAHAEDERREIERIMAEMSGLCQELGINMYVVAHLATPEGTPHEEGGRVMAKHFKGSRSIIYWAHFMFGFERNTQAEDIEDRHRTTARCLKDRFTGSATGELFYLGYDALKGLLFQTNYTPEAAGSKFGPSDPQSDF